MSSRKTFASKCPEWSRHFICERQFFWRLSVVCFGTDRTGVQSTHCRCPLSLAFVTQRHLVFFSFYIWSFLIFARENKPCPVTGMALRPFAEVSTIDIAQLALKQGRQVLLSPITCRQAQHTYSHIESPRRCVCGFKYGNPTHFQPKFISLRSRITALPTSTTSQTLLHKGVAFMASSTSAG